MRVITYEDVLREAHAEIEQATSHSDAMLKTVSILKRRMPDYNWVGIYLLAGDHLELGPFLGKPSPHTRIPLNAGICGAAATHRKTIVVDDVNADPRYLACSIETHSEIVVPIMRGTQVLGEIDIDSDKKAAFKSGDRELLEAIAALLAQKFPPALSERSESNGL